MIRMDRPANVCGGDHRLELNTAPDDIVHLWVDKNISNPKVYVPVLKALLDGGKGAQLRRPRYRFLGAHRERKSGVDCLCISFCRMAPGGMTGEPAISPRGRRQARSLRAGSH